MELVDLQATKKHRVLRRLSALLRQIRGRLDLRQVFLLRGTPACGHYQFNVPPVGGRKLHHGPVGTNSKAPGTTVDPAAVFAAVATQRDGLPYVGIDTSSSTNNTTTIPAWQRMGV